MTLRNAIHETLSAAYGREDWYELISFQQSEREKIDEAKRRIERDGRAVIPGRVVAELMFGFWTALTGTAYAQSLWDKHLYRAFRSAKVSRKGVAKRLKKIRFLRNRVAHHESVIGKKGDERDLKQDVSEIIETTGWICPTTARWIAINSSFDSNYAKRPRLLEVDLPFGPNDTHP